MLDKRATVVTLAPTNLREWSRGVFSKRGRRYNSRMDRNFRWFWMWVGAGGPIFGCAFKGKDAPAPASPPHVVLISIDTTRADALGCYTAESHWGLAFPADSRPVPRTPILDSIADSGVRFAWALAHAPTTLSSHTTMLSGRDAHRHRVVRNGYSVPPDIPLVSEHLASAGWDTIAVLGSSALERKMGMNRGFHDYFDPGPQPPGGMYMLPADEVTRRALARVDGRPTDNISNPLFLFVHYYDPHMPWNDTPPSTQAGLVDPSYSGPVDGSMNSVAWLTQARVAGTLRYRDARQARALYLSQVAYVDEQIGVLLAGLKERRLLDNTVLVVVSDHGETLDESAVHPYSHGAEVGLWDIHVPWLIRGYGAAAERVPAGKVVREPVGLVDVPATILGLVGQGTAFGDGIDTAPLWTGNGRIGASPIFSEATKPMNREATQGWNNLPFERSVVEGGLQARYRPLDRGLATLHAVAPGAPPVDDVDRLKAEVGLLQAWDAAAPPFRPSEYDAATEAALRQLGYLD